MTLIPFGIADVKEERRRREKGKKKGRGGGGPGDTTLFRLLSLRWVKEKKGRGGEKGQKPGAIVNCSSLFRGIPVRARRSRWREKEKKKNEEKRKNCDKSQSQPWVIPACRLFMTTTHGKT